MTDPPLDTTTLERVIVLPRNGYANRLQAWASSAILAAHLDVPLEVAWEPQPIAPAGAADLFTSDRPGATFLTSADLRARIGGDHQDLPRYLTIDPSRQVVCLAGHERGEQVFMPDLAAALGHASRPRTLLVIAGGKFHLPGALAFAEQRSRFYAQLPWSAGIRAGTDAALAGHSDFIGLHIRETDRSIAAPTPGAIRGAVAALAERSGLTSLFIAADTLSARQRWLGEARSLGLSAWTTPEPALDRSAISAGIGALIDWRILGMAQSIVYSRESSFGEEAAVATGCIGASLPLSASSGLQRIRRAEALGRAAVTYPRRRWGQGRKPS